jgi:hypothetical protein
MNTDGAEATQPSTFIGVHLPLKILHWLTGGQSPRLLQSSSKDFQPQTLPYAADNATRGGHLPGKIRRIFVLGAVQMPAS